MAVVVLYHYSAGGLNSADTDWLSENTFTGAVLCGCNMELYDRRHLGLDFDNRRLN